MLRWLEITADYECNNRCVGCFSVQADGAPSPKMSTAEAMRWLAHGRAEGARGFWFGGGEPTLRADAIPLVAAARRLGYERIKLQTNAMRLAYPDFTRRLAAAGATEINASIKGPDAATHDALARTPGCFDLMVRGIAEARRAGLAVEGDVLVYRSNAPALPAIVRTFHALGVERFSLWLFTAMGAADPALVNEVPRIADVMPHIVRAMDLGLSDRPDFITTLHTPPCTVPETHHRALFYAPDLALLVTNPGGHRFLLETSPIEGGVYLDRCGGCRLRPRCDGARADYLAQFGDGELRPIT